MKKKILASVLSLMMVFSLIPTLAFAEGENEEMTSIAAEQNEATEETKEEDGSTLSDAAQKVQDMIDALPSVDELAAMDSDGQNDVYEKLQAASEAYDELAEEEQKTVDDSVLDKLFEYFNSLTVTTENTENYVAVVYTDTVGDGSYYTDFDALVTDIGNTIIDGMTVKLLNNATWTLTANKTITIGLTFDLNGHTLMLDGNKYITFNPSSSASTVAFIDSSGSDGKVIGAYGGSYGMIRIKKSCTVTFKNVTFENTSYGYAIELGNSSYVIDLTAENCTFVNSNTENKASSTSTSIYSRAVYLYGNSSSATSEKYSFADCKFRTAETNSGAALNIMGGSSDITINNCTITSAGTTTSAYALCFSTNMNSDVTVTNTTITAASGACAVFFNYSVKDTADINFNVGNIVTGQVRFGGNDTTDPYKVKVTDGSFSYTVDGVEQIPFVYGNTSSNGRSLTTYLTLTGGYYKVNVSSIAASKYECVTNTGNNSSEYPYTISYNQDATNYFISNDDGSTRTYYDSLNAALKANDTGTVYFSTNCTLTDDDISALVSNKKTISNYGDVTLTYGDTLSKLVSAVTEGAISVETLAYKYSDDINHTITKAVISGGSLTGGVLNDMDALDSTNWAYYMTDSNADGTLDIVNGSCVYYCAGSKYSVGDTSTTSYTAEIDGKLYFASLSTAAGKAITMYANDATTKHTVKLLQDTTADITITNSAATLVLDLNEKTLNGHVYITYSAVDSANNANVTIKNGSINEDDAEEFALSTNGTLTGVDLTLQDVDVENASGIAIYLASGGNTVFDNCTISGSTGIVARSSAISITDTTVTATGAASTYDDTYSGGAQATGDAIMLIASGYPGGAPSITTFTGVTAVSENGNAVVCETYTSVEENGTDDIQNKQFISDGYYSSDVSEYVVSGSTAVPTSASDTSKPEGGTWTVSQGAYVAAVTDSSGNVMSYDALSSAVDAVDNGSTLTLLGDASVIDDLALSKSFTFDLNGKNLNIGKSGDTTKVTMSITDGAAVNIADSSKSAGGVVYNYGLIDITSGTLDISELGYTTDGSESGGLMGGLSGQISLGEESTFVAPDAWETEWATAFANAYSVYEGGNEAYIGYSDCGEAGIWSPNVPSATGVYTSGGNQYSGIFYSAKVGATVTCGDNTWICGTGFSNLEENPTELYWEMCVARNTNTSTAYLTLQSAIDEADSDDTIQLLTDVTECVTIDKSQKVTLDLAGYNLTGNGDYAIDVEGGTFTLADSVGSGTVTRTDDSGYVVYVTSSSKLGKASFTLEGGTITGGINGGIYARGGTSTYKSTLVINGGSITKNSGTGVYAAQYVDMTMNGGTITGNARGVYLVNTSYPSTFTMSGGTISSNKTSGDGGGVYVKSGNKFVMTGGAINGNEASTGGGVYAETKNNTYYFQMSGGAIYDNTTTSSGNDIYATNVNTYTKATILNAASMEELKYTAWRSDADGTSVTDTTTLNGTVYLTAVDGTEEYDTLKITYDVNGGSGTMPTDSKEYTSGMIATTASGDGLLMEGYYFAGWNTVDDGSGTDYAVGDTFIITKDTTLYAVWKETVAQVYDSEGTLVGSYNTLASAVSGASSGQTVKLVKDINLTSGIQLSTKDKSVTIDLNGHNITLTRNATGSYVFSVQVSSSNGTLTLTNSQSTGGVITNASNYDATDCVVKVTRGHLVVEENVTLCSTNGNGISLGGYSTAYNNGTIQATVAINGSSVSGGVAGVVIQGDTKNTTEYGPILTVNSGSVTGGTFGISGNGTATYGSTTININGGTITSDNGTGIYHPQVGTLNITGGTINGPTGIEMRAGTLNVSKGTITGTATTFTTAANGSGTTVDGAGIAVSQHSTDREVTVNVTGGTISGYYGIYEINTYANTNSSAVTINISEKDTGVASTIIKATNDSGKAIYSESISGSTKDAEDITNITISGGHFTTTLANTTSYLADGYFAYTEASNTEYHTNGYPYSVGKIDITLDTSEYTYSGSYHQPTPTVTFNNTKLTSGTDYNVSYSNNKDAGTATATIAGTGNYAGTGSITFTIEPAELTITGLTATNKVYDGTNTVTLSGGTLSGVISGDDVSAGSIPTTGTMSDVNAGENKTVSISEITLTGNDKGNYTLTQPTVTVTITPATLMIYRLEAVNKTYDGNTTVNLSGGTLIGTIYNGDEVSLGTVPATGEAAGASVGDGKTVTFDTIKLTGDNAGNYQLAQPTVTVDITAATPTVSLTDKTAAYTGSAIESNSAAVTLVNDETYNDKISYTYYTDADCTKETTAEKDGAESNGGAPSNAGTYYVKASIDAAGNYTEATSSAAKLTIEKASPDVSLSMTASKTYDGTAVEDPKVSVTLTNNEEYSGTTTIVYYDMSDENNPVKLDSAPSAVGDYKVVVTVDAGSNYESKSMEATFSIAEATQNVTITGFDVTYDGNTHEVTVDAESGSEISIIYKDADGNTITGSPVNAGTYTANVTVTKEGYAKVTSEIVVTINKAVQSISYSEAYVTKTVDDEAFTNELTQATVYGDISYESSDESVAKVDENGKVTIVGAGTATITATVSGSDNYTADSASYTLTVNQVGEYDGYTSGDMEGVTADIPVSKLLSSYDRAMLADGHDVEFVLTINDHNDDVSETDAAKIEAKAGSGLVAVSYMDINLTKYVYKQGSPDPHTTTQMTDPLEAAIRITVSIPDSMLQEVGSESGTYSVIRIHDGTAETLATDYDSTDNTVSFSTDRFSTYAIVFTKASAKDVTGSTGNSSANNNGNTSGAENTADSSAADSSQTGDNVNLVLWIALMIIAAAAIIVALTYRRKMKYSK